MRKLAALFVIGSALSFGGSITTVNQINGTTFEVNDLTGFNTTGNMMGGMTITGVFASGSDAVCVWVNGGGSTGGCTANSGDGNGFQFSQTGSTFFNPFLLTSISGEGLLSLLFNGIPGNTVFDRTFSGNAGTDGSSLGNSAEGTIFDGPSRTINGTATYMDRVATLGNPPVGDIFARLLITFNGGGLIARDSAEFYIDTDNVGLRNGEPGSGIPEPSTFGMLGAALAGLAIFRRRRA